MTAYFRFVLRHRLAVLGLCLLVTALSAAFATTGVVSSTIKKMFFGESPRYLAYQARAKRFGGDELLMVGYRDPRPLSPASLARLEKVQRLLVRAPEVSRAHTLLDAQRVWSDGEDLRVAAYADEARERPGEADAVTARLARDPRYSGTLISRDGRHAAVLVELKVDPNRRGEKVPQLLARLVSQFRAAGFDEDELHLAGIPPMMSSVIEETYRNFKRVMPYSSLALLLTVLIAFRRLAPALLAMGISGVAAAWTLGFTRLLDRDYNVLVSMVPAVITIVAFSDVIHLWSAYQIELKRGKGRREAILASAADVGTACLLTSATTFVGFVCLSLIPTPMFRQMGLVLGFGVAVALLLAMTLVPVVLSLLPEGRTARPPSPAMDRALDRVSGLCSGHPWLVAGLFVLIGAGAAFGLARLNIETDLAARISEDTRFRRDQRFFASHFVDTNSVEVFVDTRAREGLLDPAVFHGVHELQRRLAALPAVEKAVSLVDLIAALHGALAPPNRTPPRRRGDRSPPNSELPRSRQALAQYLLLYEMSGGEHLDQLVDFTRRSMRMVLRLGDHGARATYRTGLEADRLGQELLRGTDARVESSGLLFLLGWWLDAIIEGQRNGLGLSFLVIAAMMIVGLRSLRVGLVSMIPNLLPLLAMGGYLGATLDRVDSDAMGLAMIAIGIGVDDTIHFLMRYRIESRRCDDRAEAIRRTFAFSGRAILLTTVVLVAGFIPFATSDYLSTRMMGTLLPLVLVMALLADLLLVPALVQLRLLSFGRGQDRPSSGATS
jgi:predicted RND superfamily exporter protein